MTPDPKLVEALADLLRTAGDEPLWWPQDVARRFVTRHRLVQLPEEPDGWQAEMPEEHPNGPGWIRPVSKEYATDEALGVGSNRIRPVYIIPGDPQEVEP